MRVNVLLPFEHAHVLEDCDRRQCACARARQDAKLDNFLVAGGNAYVIDLGLSQTIQTLNVPKKHWDAKRVSARA